MTVPQASTKTVLIERSRVSISAIDLVVVSGGKRQTRRLGLEPTVVGSDASADVVVTDPAVSRRHCALTVEPLGVRVTDLGSKNGTYCGRVRVRDAHVPTTERLSLSADSELHLVALDAPPTEIPLSLNVRFGEAIGGSIAMRALFSLLERAAPTRETVLLLGESGTGKELLARGIHDASDRRQGPFVTVDCGAIAPSLVESELFGHVRGAFTGADAERRGAFALANGGTLFLDEIGELPLELQPKLLRALEARTYQPVGANAAVPFDARIVAATHRDLGSAIAEGTFREDLYFRLAVLPARVPALRDRRDDIELLAERFLEGLTPPRTLASLPPSALAMLEQHDFPGNVRELKNVVIRLALFPELVEQAFERPRGAVGPAVDPFEELRHLPLREARDQVVAEFERKYITTVLEQNRGNVSHAATAMGVSRQFLHRMLTAYGIRAKGRD